MDVKWIDFFKELGFTSGFSILLFLLIAYLARKRIELYVNGVIELKKAELGRDLEQLKQSLATQSQIHKLELDKALEGYKSSLQQVSQEHQIRFSKLHADRAEVVKILFTKILTLEISMDSYLDPSEMNKNRASIGAVVQNGDDFREFFTFNELLFNEETCKIIDELNRTFIKAFIEHDFYYRGRDNAYEQCDEPDPYFDMLKKDIPKLKKILIDDFRKTLGVV